jgi:uncharacterized coiled-coil protein SlyX
MARVIISSGHTSSDPGTVIDGLREVDIARKIAKKVTPYLRFNGVITLSVPYDLDLPKRVDWINSTGYKSANKDLLVEIHLNEGGKSGFESWFLKTANNLSQQLAAKVTEAVTALTGLTDQGSKDEKEHPFGGINLLQQVNPIPVLLECLYMDNEADKAFINDDNKLELLAKAIAKGICDFLGVKFNDPKPEIKGSGKSSTATIPAPAQKLQTQQDRPAEPRPAAQVAPVQQPAPKPQYQAPNPVPISDGFDDFEDDFSFPAPPRPAANNNFGGGFGGNNAFGGNSFGGGFNNPAAPKQMTRDERKEMINKYYKKGLGKEPNQNDLNYFLNIGISEDQLLKRILDSQEHLDMTVNAGKYGDLKKNHDELDAKLKTLEKNLADQRQVMDKLNSLLLQKNQALTEMQRRIQLLNNRIEDIQISQGAPKLQIDYKRSWFERLLEYLSKKLS